MTDSDPSDEALADGDVWSVRMPTANSGSVPDPDVFPEEIRPRSTRRSDSKARRWVLTIFNATGETVEWLGLLGAHSKVQYLVYGNEETADGRPHLQMYVHFTERVSWSQMRAMFAPAHFDIARGSGEANRRYCTKDGDFVEFGVCPGARISMGERYLNDCRAWMMANGRELTFTDAAAHLPAALKHWSPQILLTNCSHWWQTKGRRDFAAEQDLDDSEPVNLHDWQAGLDEYLEGEADDRKVRFYVDRAGGAGKSWMCNYLAAKRDDIQIFDSGKTADLAFAVNVLTRVFLIDVARGGIEFLQYRFLERLKDGRIFSSKYQSVTKWLVHRPVFVVVFCNEMPDMSSMTDDRYDVIELS